MTDIVELLRNPPSHMGQDNWQVLCNKAADELEKLRAERNEIYKDRAQSALEIERLRALLKECADELEAQIEYHYDKTKSHPAIKRRYDSDMQPVLDARAALGQKP